MNQAVPIQNQALSLYPSQPPPRNKSSRPNLHNHFANSVNYPADITGGTALIQKQNSLFQRSNFAKKKHLFVNF